MSINEKKKVWVVGHKNPDTDSICAAIAYANLKNQADGNRYEAKRAGELNEETKYVLDTFGVKSPGLITDVGAQVKDIEIRKTPGVSGKISLKRAWEMMKEQNVVTLPVTDKENNLEGLIITGDIATSYMDVYDNSILSRAKTQYQNIVDTLDGTMLCGNEHAYFMKGKVVVGSANPETMEQFLEDDDLVIMGNRYDAQICALESNASCIVIAGSPQVPKTIVKMAEEKHCVLITTDYDTYTAARLINQSMPISYFMKTEALITFEMDDYIDDIKDVIISSVVPKIMHSFLNGIRKYMHKEPIVVGPGIRTGISVKAENPKAVGADRIVDAAGAYYEYGGPCLVVDFGTATTYDYVDANGNFEFGVIALGIETSAQAMWTQAAKLPEIEIKKPKTILNKTTTTSMQAGLVYGYIGQSEYIIKQFKKELGVDMKVIATGGLGKIIYKNTDEIDIYDRDLTFKGLKHIYEKYTNEKKRLETKVG